MRDLLASIEAPVLIIDSARDPVVPPVNAGYLHDRLPKNRLDIIIWEVAADTDADVITNWWAGGHASASAGNP